ncbi:MAG: serine hydrolase domain-containing protein [Bacteroidota bacterium]
MKYASYICLSFLLMLGCVEEEPIPPVNYDCELSFPDKSASHPQQDAFQTALELLGENVSGVQVAIRTADHQFWLGAGGWADMSIQQAMEPCHKTMIGSVSKIYTAVLILQLQQENRLDIEDSLSDWLDAEILDGIENADQVNIRQLLNHTSGIRDYLGAKQFINSLNKPYFRQTQLEKLSYVRGKSAYHAPEADYTYSNTNYVLLGLIVEKARNMPLWEVVDQYLAQPLGLENTQMGTHIQPIPDGTARPYYFHRGKQYRNIMPIAVADAATGDGGIASNMQEVSYFIEALFEGQLLDSSTLAQMTNTLTLVGEEEADFSQWPGESYGLGLNMYQTPYGPAYGHTGLTSTYNTFVFYFPDQQMTLAIAYNGDGTSDIWDQRRSMRERFMELMFE